MADTDIPEPVRRFVDEHIESVRQLEVLLLLRGTPDTGWTAEAASRELRSNSDWALIQLEGLRTAGLLVAEGDAEAAYRYAPQNGELEAVAEQLQQAFQQRRSAVIRLVLSRSQTDTVRTFADAFSLRRKDRGWP